MQYVGIIPTHVIQIILSRIEDKIQEKSILTILLYIISPFKSIHIHLHLCKTRSFCKHKL